MHTAGNSSGIVDGAAAVLIGSEAKGRELGLAPRGAHRRDGAVGCRSDHHADRADAGDAQGAREGGHAIDDIDLFEVNEAFAAVPMRFMREMGVPHEKVNVNGGAIAMGHPLGATGAMLLGTLLDELERRKLKHGADHAVRRRRHGHRDDRREASDVDVATCTADGATPNARRCDDADGIATLTFDEPGSAVNTMTERWQHDLAEAAAQLERDKARSAACCSPRRSRRSSPAPS